MDDRELILGIPIFGAIGEDTTDFLLNRAERVDVKSGEYFFRQGDPGDGVYVIRTGSVMVLKERAGEGVYLRSLGAGDCFGEMSLIAMIGRTASIRASEATSAILLKNAHLMELYERDLEQFTLLMMNMSREVCRRYHELDEMLFNLAPGAALAKRKF